MGAIAQAPPTPTPIGAVCTVLKTSDGEFVISGNKSLLRDYFEASPEQWLRCLALKGTKNGKTTK